MTNPSLTCSVCGCALSQSDKACPLCGAPSLNDGVHAAAPLGNKKAVQTPPPRSSRQSGKASGASCSSGPRHASPRAQSISRTATIVKSELPVGNHVRDKSFSSQTVFESAQSQTIVRHSSQGQPSSPSDKNGGHSSGFTDLGDAHRRKVITIVLVALSIFVLVGVAVLGLSAWQHAQVVSQQPEQTDDGNKKRVQVTARVAPESHAGSTSGALAGGGMATVREGGLYLGSSEGVYAQDTGSVVEGAALNPVANGQVSCLNWRDGNLYYLSSTKAKSTEADVLSAVCVLKSPKEGAVSTQQATALYQGVAGSQISSLCLWDETLYFVEKSGNAFSLMELSTLDTSEPRLLDKRASEEAWVFVENDTLYFVTTSTTNWSVLSRKRGDSSTGFKTVMQGEGSLKTACFANGVLYYSLKEAQGASGLYQKSFQGEFKDYPETTGVLRISAVGDVIAVVTQAGKLQWVSGYTQYVYDVSWVLESGLDGANPQKMALSACGEWIYVRDDKGRIVQFNVNTDEAWLYSTSASDSKNSTSGGLLATLVAAKVVA